ncbi:MATE family efflux transporter [Tolumonas osonensis]|uniref:O-antigen/teichoic acid export membrane protein n=1 Tax=Tolumonas osonensis TaxID=675874 RepID=A0A841GFF3_9GAMM|nr:MATE family efflux transporter [Tolumonas osonensis]MBB6056699.1 O-antigen/teichoic acid export membrane protein [Tolumonas osonensis]
MLLTLGVTLYTSRVVINALGVEDYGLYNVVGGVVTLFSFLSGAMSSATQRFFSFEIGRNDVPGLHNVFKMSFNIYVLIVVVVIIFSETLGLWFLNSQLAISPERIDAANWVYQCAIFSFCCTIMGVPYNACIIAYEKMRAFAYISIVDVFLKLGIVFLLEMDWDDRLEIYAILTALVSFIIWCCYYLYARRNFAVSRYQLFWNTEMFKTLFSYTGWNLFGNLAAVMSNQGVNILLNIFFGSTVNAARAIAFQVNSAIVGFVSSLQMSINPQIIKSYAANDHKYMQQLVFAGARYSFFLLYLISIPILLQTDFILKIWLKTIPDYSVSFCRLVVIDALIMTMSGTLMTAFQATGRIKIYQVVVGVVILCNLPISYFFLSVGFDANITFLVSIFISLLAFILRVLLLSRLLSNIVVNFYSLIAKVFSFLIFSLSISLLMPELNKSKMLNFLFSSALYWFVAFMFIWLVGITSEERKFIKSKLITIF